MIIRTMMTRTLVTPTMLAAICTLAAAMPACAYTPQVFNPATDRGITMSSIPVNARQSTIYAALKAAGFGDIWGSGFYAAGSALWITSAAASRWQDTGFMTNPTGCNAGYGYGHFHWRAQVGYDASQEHQGPGVNIILWRADNDPGWPGLTKGSTDGHIGEVDAMETSYADNGQTFATFHHYDAKAPRHDGQIMLYPMVYPAGTRITSMHDYDIYWAAGTLVEYLDGTMQHAAPAALVEPDFAHGGCNYTLGAQMAMQATGYDHLPTDQLLLANMWWDASAPPEAVPVVATAMAPPAKPVPRVTVARQVSVAPTTSGLTITSATLTGARLSLKVTKATGGRATLRLLLDGKYIGALDDNAPDGGLVLSYTLRTVPAAGTHIVRLYTAAGPATSVPVLAAAVFNPEASAPTD